VVTREQGAALQPDLRPGQRLVSREGDLWRWDGYTAAADAPTAAATRLAERNRLGAWRRRKRRPGLPPKTAKQAFEAARREIGGRHGARPRGAREPAGAAATLETARGSLPPMSAPRRNG
jgi:chromosome segregation protein